MNNAKCDCKKSCSLHKQFWKSASMDHEYFFNVMSLSVRTPLLSLSHIIQQIFRCTASCYKKLSDLKVSKNYMHKKKFTKHSRRQPTALLNQLVHHIRLQLSSLKLFGPCNNASEIYGINYSKVVRATYNNDSHHYEPTDCINGTTFRNFDCEHYFCDSVFDDQLNRKESSFILLFIVEKMGATQPSKSDKGGDRLRASANDRNNNHDALFRYVGHLRLAVKYPSSDLMSQRKSLELTEGSVRSIERDISRCYESDDSDIEITFSDESSSENIKYHCRSKIDSVGMNPQPDSGFSDLKKVRFDLNPKVHVMRTWAFAYRLARKGDWEIYARDRARFQHRIQRAAIYLDPILSNEHRIEIFKNRFSD